MRSHPETKPETCSTHPDVHLICPRCRAQRVGAAGGRVSTPKKARAARRNGKQAGK